MHASQTWPRHLSCCPSPPPSRAAQRQCSDSCFLRGCDHSRGLRVTRCGQERGSLVLTLSGSTDSFHYRQSHKELSFLIVEGKHKSQEGASMHPDNHTQSQGVSKPPSKHWPAITRKEGRHLTRRTSNADRTRSVSLLFQITWFPMSTCQANMRKEEAPRT